MGKEEKSDRNYKRSNNKMKLLFLTFAGLAMAGTKCSGDMCWARGPRPRKPAKSDKECSIDSYKTNPESWNMNCPDSCEIMEFLDVVEKRIAEEWAMVKSNFEINVDKSGMGNNRREILEILLIKLKKIKNSSMSEAEKFEAYTKLYRDANVPRIIAEQEQVTSKLEERQAKLHSELISLKVELNNNLAFCLLNFKEYGEHICDVRSFQYGQGEM